MIISREAKGKKLQSDSRGWMRNILMRIVISLDKCTFESILHICRIMTIFHPDAFLQAQRITQVVQETRNIALEPKRVKVTIPLGINRPILVLVDAKLASPTIGKDDFFIGFGYKNCTRNRRTQGCHEEPMVATSCGTENGASSVSSQSVGD
jgi:hypothetical protein